MWSRVASTVKPLRRDPPETGEVAARRTVGKGTPSNTPEMTRREDNPLHHDAARRGPPPRAGEVRPRPPDQRPLDRHGLDASWDRKLAQGLVAPDFTLDLHGHSLDAAHARLEHGLALALAQGARVVLLVTGRARPTDDHAARGSRRGAIRAKMLDWLAAGPHAGRIAAVRPAHPRHGGAGAVYIVLRRPRD